VHLKRFAVLIAWSGLGGSLAAIGSYLLLNFTPFGPDVIESSRNLRPVPQIGQSLVPLIGSRLALLPDILAGFLLTRLPALLLEGAAVVVCVAWSRRRLALVLSVSVPFLWELLLAAKSFDSSWLGMLWALLVHWPSQPEYIVPFGRAVRVTTTYVVPALFCGLAGWLCAGRFTRGQARDLVG
jgi:hypothetical protein